MRARRQRRHLRHARRARPARRPPAGGVASFVQRYSGPYALVAGATSVTEGHTYRRGAGPAHPLGDDLVAQPRHVREPRAAARAARPLLGLRRHERALGAAPAAGTAPSSRCPAARTYSYLLPAALPAGRYVLDIRATDDAGNVTTPRARHLEDRLPCPLGDSRSAPRSWPRCRGPAPLAPAAVGAGASPPPRRPCRAWSSARGGEVLSARARSLARVASVARAGAGPAPSRRAPRSRCSQRCAAAGGPAFALRDYGRCGGSAGELGTAVRVLARRRGEPRPERLGVQGRRRRRQHRRGGPERAAGQRPRLRPGARVLWFWCQASGRRLRAHARSRTRRQLDRARGARSR